MECKKYQEKNQGIYFVETESLSSPRDSAKNTKVVKENPNIFWKLKVVDFRVFKQYEIKSILFKNFPEQPELIRKSEKTAKRRSLAEEPDVKITK